MMQDYYGTKHIKARPMTRGQYNEFRGWQLPDDEDPNDSGYLVEYQDGGAPNVLGFDGYVSWSPLEVFEQAYQSTQAMSFGHALEALQKGHAVSRAGWNGKGMFLYHVPAGEYPARTHVAKGYWGVDSLVPYGAYIAMKTADNNVVPWLASQTDMLANDWGIVS